jgi:hypothetical protein
MWYNFSMTFSAAGLQKLDEKLFYFPNFISEEDVRLINEKIKETESIKHPFEEMRFGTTPSIPELFPVWEKVSELIAPDYVIHPLLNLLHFKEGASMDPHCDSPGEGNHEELTMPDMWSTCCLLSYGVCVYFGEYTGGEVYYPNQNITIPVKPGDLVIHGALEDYSHGVKEVTSGSRYTYSNFALRADKNPGTFYNYGTEEYKEKTKNLDYLVSSWQTPLIDNPLRIVLSEDRQKY